MRDRDLVSLLKRNQWVVIRIKGSHHVLQKNGQTIVVPVHGRDIPTGLLKTILKQAGLNSLY